MSKLVIEKVNDVLIKVHCDADIAQELSEYFTFTVPGARFLPQVRKRHWDGKIRLFSTATHLIYNGLRLRVEIFARERNYEVDYIDQENFLDNEYSIKEANEFIESLKLTLAPRDYQVEAFTHAVRTNRCVLLSPTASGKSLIIYLISRKTYTPGKKVLIIVPTTSLVHQMASDFQEYCEIDHEQFCHKILSGAEKETNRPFVISTWQSIYKMPKMWFTQFNTVIGDEAHLFKAKSLSTIMTKLVDCKYRFGFTGTLDGTQTHKLVLEGLFGPVKRVTSTSTLIEQKHLADLKIKAIVLTYTDEEKKKAKGLSYHDEMDFIVRNDSRNRFLTNLALSLEGNTLILFQFVDKHGKVLYDLLKDSKQNLFFVSGEVDGDIREDIRQTVEQCDDSIIVASYGTFSTGVNIKNLHNIIFASPSKSRIRNLQSIGRGLRKSSTKSTATLYDIADDLSWKSTKNHTLLHFAERIKIYNEESFSYKIYNIKLKE